ncbi:MAG TPA: prepilin peptidase [Candidatus Saccharimonadales bacterium]|nr:prepilin peptidase [Candidatus Saccharimonadales bacterium]
MFVIVLILLGLCFGSFINALVYRLHARKGHRYSIINGRSMCPHCKHELAPKDLIPLLSWAYLRGKCRYCSKPISRQYPLVESSTAVLFVLSYLFWPYELVSTENLVAFTFWLILLVGFIALTIYDLKYLILPNRLIFPLAIIAVAGIAAEVLLLGGIAPLTTAFWGLIVGGGIFYVLFQVSAGKWIGGGDVKLGFLLGAVVGGPWAAFLMLFLASLIGTIYALPQMLTGRLEAKSRIPFGPFLIIAAIIVQLFGSGIIDWYQNLFSF